MSQSVQPEEMNVSGKRGEAIVLPIATGPATGHSWRLELPAGVQRIADGPARAVSPANSVGSGTGGNIRVEAAEAGNYVIEARLARPWELDRPVRVVRINLHVSP
jgi:predicted secreted protein